MGVVIVPWLLRDSVVMCLYASAGFFLHQSATGGRVTVMQTQLPTVGPGALKCREDPSEKGGKVISLSPPIKMALLLHNQLRVYPPRGYLPQ